MYFDGNKDTPLLALPGNYTLADRASCKTLLDAGYTSSGVYTVCPGGSYHECIQVLCDMTSDCGGWTVVVRRQDGSVDFYRKWADYQVGFGDLSGEFWLGNDNLVTLTSNDSRVTWEVRFDLEDWDGNTAWARYNAFKITQDSYTLHLGTYDASSTAGDGFGYNRGSPFSTKDRGNQHCAKQREGAWWYDYCSWAQLTGKYYQRQNDCNYCGIMWFYWKGKHYSLKESTMKIRENTLD